jgi:hypothetical protein
MSEIEYERRCPNCWYCGDSYEGMPAYEAEDVDGDMVFRHVCSNHFYAVVECVSCDRYAWRPENMELPLGWHTAPWPDKYYCPTCH